MSGAGKKIRKGIKKVGKQLGVDKIRGEIKKGVKKVTENALDVATVGTYSAAKKGIKKFGDMMTPEVPDIIIQGDEAPAEQSQYVMPDEEEIRRARRRRGRTSQTGRSSTILSSNSDRLGG